MKKIMKRLISWLIYTLAISSVCAQDIQSTLQLAKNSLKNHEFVEAEKLFKRVLFFDSTSSYDQDVLEGLAYASFVQTKYKQASAYFLSLSQLTGSQTHYYWHIITQLKLEQWMFAKRSALNIVDSTEDAKVSKKIFLGLTEFALRNFDVSKKYFVEAEEILNKQFETESIFQNAKKINKRSKAKAIILSGVMPGLGQAYTGHIKEGINSFMLISTIGAVYASVLINIGLVDAIITILPWFHRYYVGGMNAAGGMVNEFIEEKLLLEYNNLVLLYGPEIQ